MKNSIKVIIAVVAVALIGGGVYYSNTGLQQGSLGKSRGSLNSQPGSLLVSRDTVTNIKDSQIVAGTTNVTFAAFKLTAGNTADLRIKQITIRNIGSNTDGIVNIGLYDGSRLLDDNPATTKVNEGTIKTSLGMDGDPKAVTFIYDSGSPVVIPKNSSKVITVKANTVYAATAGQTVQFKIEGIQVYNIPGATIRAIVSYASDTDALKVLYPTKLNFDWTVMPITSLPRSISQAEVARFTMGADAANANDQGAYVSVSALNFKNLSTANLTNFTLQDLTMGGRNEATNANSSNFYSTEAGGSMLQLFFEQGVTRTFKILADVSANANDSVQFRFSAGSPNTAGSAIWSVAGYSTVSGITWTTLDGGLSGIDVSEGFSELVTIR